MNSRTARQPAYHEQSVWGCSRHRQPSQNAVSCLYQLPYRDSKDEADLVGIRVVITSQARSRLVQMVVANVTRTTDHCMHISQIKIQNLYCKIFLFATLLQASMMQVHATQDRRPKLKQDIQTQAAALAALENFSVNLLPPSCK